MLAILWLLAPWAVVIYRNFYRKNVVFDKKVFLKECLIAACVSFVLLIPILILFALSTAKPVR